MPGCRQWHKAGGMKSRETVYLAYFIEIPHSQLRLVLLLAKIQVIWQLRCQHLKFAFPFASSVLAQERYPRAQVSVRGDCETVADRVLLSYAALITRYISPESARKYTNSHTPCHTLTHTHAHTVAQLAYHIFMPYN